MAHITEAALVHEVRSFGWRVFDLADRAAAGAGDDRARVLRSAVATASRHVARAETALESRLARREREKAFKCLIDAVHELDAVAALGGDLSVEASALASEATEITDRLYDLVEA